MGYLTWDKKYEIGLEDIDAQHKRWLELLNEFYDKLSGDEIKERLFALLKDASDYTEYHFDYEEKLMKRLLYPGLEKQHEMHGAIKATLESFRQNLETRKFFPSSEVTVELKR
jgi:hemerythrin